MQTSLELIKMVHQRSAMSRFAGIWAALFAIMLAAMLAGCGGAGGANAGSNSGERLARGVGEVGLVYLTAKRLEGKPERAARVEEIAAGALLAISTKAEPVTIQMLVDAAAKQLDLDDPSSPEQIAGRDLLNLFAQELAVRVPADELGNRWLVEPYRSEVEILLVRIQAMARAMQ